MEKVKFKSLIFVMLLTLLITCIPTIGFAEEYNLDKNIQKIKTLFEIGEDYEDFDKHVYDSYEGKKITSLYWRSRNSHINVGIDEGGNIISYSKDETSSDRQPGIYKFSKITREQGAENAKNLIKKLYPNIVEKIELVDDEELYSTYRRDDLSGYRYNFIMVENDIVFNENTIYINVNNQNGEVTSFNINWEEDLEFPATEGIISKDKAKEIYKDNIKLGLAYRVKKAGEDTKSYLGYNIIDTDKTVDAKTNDMISTSNKSIYSVYGYTSDQNMEGLTNEEVNQLINSKKIISREKASEKMIDSFKLGEDYEIQDHKLKCNKEDTYIWEVMVIKHVKNGSSGVSGRIDAKSGEILDFSNPGSWDEDLEESKYSKEELLKRAKEIIKNNSPEKYKEVEYVEDENGDLIYSRNNVSNFLFVRKVNDIRVENDGFRIILSNTTGNVTSYYHGWSDLEFESPDNLIQEDEAKESLLKDRELDLEYQTLKEEKEKKDVKLVYNFKDKYLLVDAKTGEVIDIRKELMEKEGMKEYKDIENCYAKEKIQKLQNHIVLFEGEEFKPKQEITQKEFFRLLAQTKDVYSYQDINYLYERFIREGILSQGEKDINATVTREEAIKYVIRAFGQEPLDSIGDIYKIEYKDADEISDNLKGHIAVAKGLGVISGEGKFRPKDNLTREEAAVIIYNILNR
jgi:hypothetical protein